MNGARKAARRTIVLDTNVLLDKNLSVFLQGLNPISLTPLTAKQALAEIDHYGGLCPEPNLRAGPMIDRERRVIISGLPPRRC